MNVKEAIPVMKSIIALEKTPGNKSNPDGMIIVKDSRGENALAAVNASINDEANHDQYAVQCVNCGLIVSILHTLDGCPYCGLLKMNQDI